MAINSRPMASFSSWPHRLRLHVTNLPCLEREECSLNIPNGSTLGPPTSRAVQVNLGNSGSSTSVMGNICFKAPIGCGTFDLSGPGNDCSVRRTEHGMPGNRPRQTAGLASIHRRGMPVCHRPAPGGIGAPQDQTDGIECSKAACGCDIAAYRVRL